MPSVADKSLVVSLWPLAPRAFNGKRGKERLQHDLMKEALGQIFGIFVIAAFTAQIAVDRFPVSMKQ